MSVYYFKFPDNLTILDPDGTLIFQDKWTIDSFTTHELLERWVHGINSNYQIEPHLSIHLYGQIAQNFVRRLVGARGQIWERLRGVEINEIIQREADLWYAIWEVLERLNFDGQWKFRFPNYHPLFVLIKLIHEGELMVCSASAEGQTNADTVMRRKQTENQQMRGGRNFPFPSNPFSTGLTKEFIDLALEVSARNDGFEINRWIPLLDARSKSIQYLKTTKPVIMDIAKGGPRDGRGRHKKKTPHRTLTG